MIAFADDATLDGIYHVLAVGLADVQGARRRPAGDVRLAKAGR
ncbi:hypothetical protein [Streptomyces sp. Y7]